MKFINGVATAFMVGTIAIVSASFARAGIITYQLTDHVVSQGTHPNYFSGKLLTEHDLSGDQSYQLPAKKFIGETQLDLGDLFAAAGSTDAVLLFDEADALFGKRTDVSDAHDRYGDDFLVLDDATKLWRGQLFIGDVQGVDDGVYELGGSFSETNGIVTLVAAIAEPETLSMLGPVLVLFGIRLAGRDRVRKAYCRAL